MSYEYVSNRPVCHLFSVTCFLSVTCFRHLFSCHLLVWLNSQYRGKTFIAVPVAFATKFQSHLTTKLRLAHIVKFFASHPTTHGRYMGSFVDRTARGGPGHIASSWMADSRGWNSKPQTAIASLS
jgi:hypothetical protein